MSVLWSLPSAVIALLVIVGPLGAFSGALSPGTGFRLFFAGGALALVCAIALGGAAAIAALRNSPWRAQALRAAGVPVVVTLGLVAIQATSGGPAQPFNDVTTDLADPPMYSTGPAAGEVYPEVFVEWQRDAYPGLRSLRSAEPPEAVFARALEVARRSPSWQVVREDPSSGLIEAVATTRIFRFQDDIVIRVRADAAGSVLDLRSRSRLGRGDLGANAARIETFLSEFGALESP
jgi:uncharacterized protein (DUF1499 family)